MATLFESTINTVERRLEEDHIPSLAIIFGSFVCKALTFGEIGNAIQAYRPDLFAEMDRAASVLDYSEQRLFSQSDDMLESSLHLKILYKALGEIEEVLVNIRQGGQSQRPADVSGFQISVRMTRMQVETAMCAVEKKIDMNAREYHGEDGYKEPEGVSPLEHPSRPSITYITPRLVPVFQQASMWLGAKTVGHYVVSSRSAALKDAKVKIEKLAHYESQLDAASQTKARIADPEQVFKAIYYLCDELEAAERILKFEKLRDLRHFFMAVNAWSGVFLHNQNERADTPDKSVPAVDGNDRRPRRPNAKLELVYSRS